MSETQTTACLTFFSASSRKLITADPHEDIKDILKAETPEMSALYISNGEEELSGDRVTGCIGGKRWTVVYEDDRMDRLTKELKDVKSELKDVKSELKDVKSEVITTKGTLTVLIDPWVRNVAAQILLFLAGSQPKTTTGEYRLFRAASGRFRKKIHGFAKDSALWSAKTFAADADEVLSHRNNIVHMASIAELDKLVKDAHREIAATSADLRKRLKKEVLIIDHYSLLKAFFVAKES